MAAGTLGRPDLADFKALSADGIDPIPHYQLSTVTAAALAVCGKSSAEDGQPIRGIILVQTTFKKTPLMITLTRFYLAMKSSSSPNRPFPRRFNFRKGEVTSEDLPFERPYMVGPTRSAVEDKKGSFVVPAHSDQFQPIGGPVTIYGYKL